MSTPPATRHPSIDRYQILLLLAIIFYIIIFTGLAFDQHLGMRTHKADLGQIDQAVWNSSRGRFVEMTDNGFVATRMTDHVEPILALVSPLLWLWNDVRALLLLQVIFVAIGAWPLYAIALLRLDKILSPRERTQIWQMEPLRQMTGPMALALAIAYLLAPQLQSAVLSEFHAAPLAVPLILWAFWAIETGRLWHFVMATLLVAAVKEEMALMAAGLGAWQLWRLDLRFLLVQDTLQNKLQQLKAQRLGLLLGTLVTLATLVWFYLATFVIVPAHAVQVYDSAESVYFGRYGALGDSPADILKSFFTQPGRVWQLATEPVRVRYLWGLLASFGLLSLLAPEILLLSLPLLLANLLSAYPAQYYGEFHYSAPLVPYFAISAAYGLGRLWRVLGRYTAGGSASYQHMAAASIGTMTLASLFTNARTALRPLIAWICTLWILLWGTQAYLEAGRGPLAARYDPTPITAHHRRLAHFVAQIPPDAAVTATAAVHPHVSHRRYVYQFPLGLPELGEPGQADWALLDVTTNTDMAPGDVKGAIATLLAGEWGVVDGEDGFLLLRRGLTTKQIPDTFYNFARSAPSPTVPPIDATLIFAGAQAIDWPRWRQTSVNACWTVGPAFAAAPFTPQLELVTPAGEVRYAMSAAAPPALLWVPPAQWQAGETICLQTLPMSLPTQWGVRVTSEEGEPTLVSLFERNREGQVHPLVATASAQNQSAQREMQVTARGNFLLQDQSLTLTLWSPPSITPGATLYLELAWSGNTLIDWPPDLAAFVHVRQAGATVTQADGPPRFFQMAAAPTSGEITPALTEWRALEIPSTAVVGMPITLAVGLYEPASGARLPLQQATAQGSDNELLLGPLTVEAAPLPDQSCALIPATCASQPGQ